ncbi:MAG TPA: RHS repeat-associated core domain-containing protein [Solirubrobacterales bacterium]|nr:RHS repeat-associated core domain-containing protein [Solirubrobacterales bacterium]
MSNGRDIRIVRSSLSAFGLILAIGALLSAGASGAAWTIEGKTLSELGLSEETIASTATPLTIEVPKLSLKVECESEKGSGKVISPSTDEATMEMSKCKVVESKVCTVAEPIVLKVKTELLKKAGIVYDVLKPLTGEVIGTLTLKGELCALPKELKLTGSTAGQLSAEEQAVKQGLVFSKAIAEAAGTSMLAGANPAFLAGTSSRELSGLKNKGKKWGVCAVCSFSFNAEEGYGASNPAEPNVVRSFSGSGINLGSGDLFQAQNDLATEGRGPPLELTRYYNSQLAATAKSPGAFGYGWTSTYSATLTVDEKAETATVRNDNGSTVVFYLIGAGYKPAPWVQAKLAKEGTNYVYTLPSQAKLLFNSSGQLTKVTDRHGNAITLAYNGKSQLETATDGAGRKLTFTYNVGGQVESVKDPLGHLSKYTYESSNLATVKLPEEKPRWTFGYDASHQLTSLTDGRSHATIFEYDASKRVKLEKDALERKRSIEYPSGSEAKVTEPNASTTVAVFNSAFEPTAVTLASGTAIAAKTTSEYDSNFNLKKVTDPNSHSTEFTYDGEGNRTSEKDANENEAKWTYNGTHDVLTATTPKNETTTITRNAAGDAETIKRPAPGATTQETKFEWAENGDLKSETDPLGHKTSFEYDTYGDRKAESNAAGDKRTWTFNENGQPISEVSPRGNEAGKTPSEYETKIKRDAQGRAEVVTDPLGHETKYQYDGNGDLEALTNPNGHATTYVRDAVDQVIEVKAANGNTAKTAYDTMGRVKSKTDGNEHTTKYERNELERVTEEIDPLERKTVFKYDIGGNLKERTDAEGRITTYTYDPGDRLKEIKFSEEATKTISYEYGKDDEITVLKDGTGTTTNTFDELDRLKETKNGNAEVIKYGYNLGEQMTEITYPNGKAITQGFDAAGRLEKVTDWLGKETKFTYNRDSMPTATTFPTTSTNVDEYELDRADQIVKTTMKKGAETLASISYERDAAGQLKAATQTGLPGAAKPEYGYDTRERLTAGAGSTFEYDAAGNPIKVGATTYSYDAANELKEGGGTKYTFDKVGQRTAQTPSKGPATTYGYDQIGNLKSVTRKAEGEVKEIKDTYAYDGNGLRVSETINGTTTHMAWSMAGGQPLLLYDGTNYYLYGPEGLPFEQIASEAPTYLHHDQQGSTRLLTNSSGETKGTYTYTPYGATEGHTGTATTPLGYDGQYTSADTGLIYLRWRVYDPTGPAQFISRDPLSATTGEAYGYADQSPVNKTDPSGLCTCQEPGGGHGPRPPLYGMEEMYLIQHPYEPAPIGQGGLMGRRIYHPAQISRVRIQIASLGGGWRPVEGYPGVWRLPVGGLMFIGDPRNNVVMSFTGYYEWSARPPMASADPNGGVYYHQTLPRPPYVEGYPDTPRSYHETLPRPPRVEAYPGPAGPY